MVKHFTLKAAKMFSIARIARPTMYQYGGVACGQG